MSKLQSITTSSFKGASKPITFEFEKDKKSTVIYGENGTGKSSIADAFHFVCNESVGSLIDKSVGNPKGKSLPTINTKQCSVVLKYNNFEWKGILKARS